jgi:hypothetical protein
MRTERLVALKEIAGEGKTSGSNLVYNVER